VTVNNPTTCSPLANAAVDIWHCDAQGFYSGVNANSPGSDADAEEIAEAAESIFLRGIQLTDADGVAEFITIYPGWYRGRTVHIHLMVHVGGEGNGTFYDGGHIAHIGQLFFDDAVSDEVFQLEPYAGRPEDERATNDEDGIIADHADEPGFMVALTPLTEGTIVDGFLGTITLGVDPNA
jgi:protocatechuate 3,4-dioxygenase beta subunit